MRKYEALSEHSNRSEYSTIERGTYRECVKACTNDNMPCYVVEILTDSDGDELQSDKITFVNKAWTQNRKFNG